MHRGAHRGATSTPGGGRQESRVEAKKGTRQAAPSLTLPNTHLPLLPPAPPPSQPGLFLALNLQLFKTKTTRTKTPSAFGSTF